MKITGRMAWFLSAAGKIACLFSFSVFIAACSSMALDDTAPTARPTPRAAATQPDGYPNLNVPVQAASPQLTENDRQQLTQQLSATRRSQPQGVDLKQAAAEAERLRRLARERVEQKREEGSSGEQSAIGAERLRRLALQNAKRNADEVETSSIGGPTETERLRRLASQNAERSADDVETSSTGGPTEAERLRELARRHTERNAGGGAAFGEDPPAETERLRRLGRSHAGDALGVIETPR